MEESIHCISSVNILTVASVQVAVKHHDEKICVNSVYRYLLEKSTKGVIPSSPEGSDTNIGKV